LSCWVCVCISHRFVFSHDLNELDDLFKEVLKDDYIEHHIIDLEDEHQLCETGLYVFVHCHDYREHVDSLSSHRYIRNVLNSFSNICTIPLDEIAAVRKHPLQIISYDTYKVNRSGFFMSGDVVRVMNGPLMRMQGVVIEEDVNNADFYVVLFRLFVKSFTRLIHVDDLEFVSSLFKYHKVPVTPRYSRRGRERIKTLLVHQAHRIRRAQQERLIRHASVLVRRNSGANIVGVFTTDLSACDLFYQDTTS
jgi:hypothetical protein